MDSKTKTFRHQMYSDYKATRNKTPDDLHAQIPWIIDILKALGIPVLQCDGYEADDIIATVSKKARERGMKCSILSGDKDLMQLVDQSTVILKPDAGSTWKITGIEGVKAEWGVEPKKLLDLLSLYGDTADNIPGVKGIGVVTASKLLNQYQDLDDIYAHIDEIKGATQKKLIEGKDNAFFSRKLVKLHEEVPCEEIDQALTKEVSLDYGRASTLLKDYGAFNVSKQYYESSIKASGNELKEGLHNTETEAEPEPSLEPEVPVTQNKGDYKAIKDLDLLRGIIADAIEKKCVSLDTETTDLDTFKAELIGFSLCTEEGKAYYIPLMSNTLFNIDSYIEKIDALKELERLFNTEGLDLVFHNSKFDLKVLLHNGLKVDLNEIKCNIQDTMIESWLLNPDRTGKNSYSLEYMAETRLHLKGIEYSDIVPKGSSFLNLTLELQTPYAAEDADFTFKLYKVLTPSLKDNGLYELYNNIERPLIPILCGMEIRGIHLDSSKLSEYKEELKTNIENIEKTIYDTVGHPFNIASPKQLSEVLFEERHLKGTKKTKTGYSTDTSVLEELKDEDEVCALILEYRELSKLLSTYVETLPTMVHKDGRLHTDFVQTGTATGRLSSKDPNLQNIPVRNENGRRIRSAFTSPEGKVLLSADYSQIELVVLAHLSQDERMMDSFIKGTDVHKLTASLIYNLPEDMVTSDMRRVSKTINFGVIYGMSAFRLAKDLGISRTQAKEFIDNYFKMYPKINNFITETIASCEKDGYVKTITGRKRTVPSINSKNKIEKSGGERIAVNTPVQGSAADIVKLSMIKVHENLLKSKSKATLLLQVHDELILECPDNKQDIEDTINLVRSSMEEAFKLTVPLRVSIEYGKSWGEFH